MKWKLLLLLVVATLHFCQGQDLQFGVGLFMQESDTRLFNLPKGPLVEDQIGTKTWQYSVVAQKNLLRDSSLLALKVGLGYSLEVDHFSRPFFPCLDVRLGAPCNDVLLFTQKYSVHKINAPITVNFRILKHFTIGTEIYSNFNFFKKVKTADVSKLKVEYDSFELFPAISYKRDRLEISLLYRLLHFKKIDRVIFFSTLYGLYYRPDPHSTKKYETYNPLKLGIRLSVSPF